MGSNIRIFLRDYEKIGNQNNLFGNRVVLNF